MILHCTKLASQSTVVHSEFTVPVMGAMTGRRATRISFDAKDLADLTGMEPQELWDYLQWLQTRFPPVVA